MFDVIISPRGHAKPNETVLIHGASGGVSDRVRSFLVHFHFQVGIAAIQIAKALGLRVIGTASSDQGLRAIRDQGVDLAVNHKQEGYLKEIVVRVVRETISECDRSISLAECLHA